MKIYPVFISTSIDGQKKGDVKKENQEKRKNERNKGSDFFSFMQPGAGRGVLWKSLNSKPGGYFRHLFCSISHSISIYI